MYVSSCNSLKRYMECCYSKWYVLLVVHFPDGCKCISHGFIQPSIHFFLFPPVQGEAMKHMSCSAPLAHNREQCRIWKSLSQGGTTGSMADIRTLWHCRIFSNEAWMHGFLDYMITWSFEDSAPTQKNWQWHRRHWCRCLVAPLCPCLSEFCHPAIQVYILQYDMQLLKITELLFHRVMLNGH